MDDGSSSSSTTVTNWTSPASVRKVQVPSLCHRLGFFPLHGCDGIQDVGHAVG